MREARAERANDERKKRDEPPERETPAVPTDRPGTEGMVNGKSRGEREERSQGPGNGRAKK